MSDEVAKPRTVADIEKRLKEHEDTLVAEVNRAVAAGELTHLYGRPIDLGDDSPDWMAKRLLQQNGFSHPLIEQARDLDVPRREVERVAQRLAREYSRVTGAKGGYTPARADEFNRYRSIMLGEYWAKLIALNTAILTYNLLAPDALHRRQRSVEAAVAALAEQVPPLSLELPRVVTVRRRWLDWFRPG